MNATRFFPLLLAGLGLSTGAAHASEPVESVRAYRQANAADILADYFELLSLPNVASDRENILRNARHLGNQLARRGIQTQLWNTPGAPPIVYGRLDVPGASRTLGIYLHYDGQPVDSGMWTHPPWSPTLYTAAMEDGGRARALPGRGERVDPEWRIYARSAGDDKAPAAALLAALDALGEAAIAPTSNLRFFFEGEEEAGSTHLSRYMTDHRQQLAADAWLICDGPVHQSRRPQLVFGVRGYAGLDITVYGATRYLHSGHYGNWAPNPAMNLARLLATMKNDAGDVTIEGFYESTFPVGEAERKALESVPEVDDQLRSELGLAMTEGDNAPLVERLLRPSLNVRGLQSAAVGDKARNVIPTSATASLDIRLAKGNDPEAILDLVEEHLRRQGYYLVREDPDLATRLRHPLIAKVERQGGYRAARTSMDLPIVEEVIRAAGRATADPVVLLPSMGGSLPLYLFDDLLDAPLIIVPIANHDDNQHAPDENLRLANLWYGIDLMGAILTME